MSKNDMKITQFDKSSLNQLRKQVEAVLAAVEEKSNVKFVLGTIKYDPETNTATASLKFEAKDAAGNPVDQNRLAWPKWCKLFGLKPEWLDQTFTLDGNTYRIIGLDPAARKFNVVVKMNDEKVFTMRPEAVAKAFQLLKGEVAANPAPKTIADLRQEKPSADVLASQGEAAKAAA